MIYKLFTFLEKEKITFTLLNGYDALDNKQSDIDILFKKKDFLTIENILQSFCNSKKYKLVQIYHQEVLAKNIFLFDTNSGQLLNLDIYGELSRKNVKLFNENEIFNNLDIFDTIPILAGHHEIVYYLSKKIDKKDLSESNFKHLRGLYLKNEKKCNKSILEYFPNTHKIISKAFQNDDYKNIIGKYKLLSNDFLTKSKRNFLNSVKDKKRIIKRVIKPTGIVISFLGPDGSGKSTIIDTLLSQQLPFRRNDYFHLKPTINKAKIKEVVVDPHSKPPYPSVISFMKLFYFVFQYNVGWIKNVIPIKIRSSLVIFDRYYYDLLADPKRYRYSGSKKMIQFVGRFIPTPDLVFVLTTDAKVIHERKKEVSFNELEEQIKAYRELGDKNLFFNIDVNDTPKNITQKVIDIIMHKMQERY